MRAVRVGFVATAIVISAGSASAQLVGGADETTENLASFTAWGTASAATPGWVPGSVPGTHLLISEVGIRGINSMTVGDSTEFIEIYNPTSIVIDLSTFYLSDAITYSALPVNGSIDVVGSSVDFAYRFPAGAVVPPFQARVIAIDGGRYKRGTGTDANYCFTNMGGTTSAQLMIDVASNKGAGFPGINMLANTGEFIWLFEWNGQTDLVCDGDLVYWGTPSGLNWPVLKTSATCQDGPDAGTAESCYSADAGPLNHPLSIPAIGAGTRARTGAEAQILSPGEGNGCRQVVTGVQPTTWGVVKSLFR